MEYTGRDTDFQEADRRYAELRRRYDLREIGDEEFDAELQQLMVRDESGNWWTKDRGTGEWMYHDGTDWTPGVPPGYNSGFPMNPQPQTRNVQSGTYDAPPQVQGWNWGAFLLNWIWGLFNLTAGKAALGVLIVFLGAFLAGIPGLIWAIVLGIKGNEWAWQEKRWQSVQHFQSTQRKWAWASLIVLIASVVVSVVAVVLLGLLGGTSTTPSVSGGGSSANIEDDFSDTSSGWPRESSAGLNADYDEGGYRINNPPPPGSMAALIDAGTGGDVRVEAAAASITRDPDDNSYWGVVCRASDTNNYYGLGIFPDGFSRIFKVEDGQVTTLATGNPDDAVSRGTEGNVIRGECTGSALTLYSNNQQVLQATDTKHTSGDVGLFVYNASNSGSGTEVFFDEFSVSET